MWKEYIISVYRDTIQTGQIIIEDDEFDISDDAQVWDIAQDFIAGGHYADGWGAWMEPTELGLCVDGEAIKECPPVDVFLGTRFSMDFMAYGQPDGPDTYGCVFAARVWDIKKEEEVDGTRVWGDNLDQAIAYSYDNWLCKSA